MKPNLDKEVNSKSFISKLLGFTSNYYSKQIYTQKCIKIPLSPRLI